MELSPLVDVTLRVIHDIATVIWLGGMIIYVSILLPTLRKTVPKSAERKKIIQTIEKLYVEPRFYSYRYNVGKTA